MATEVKLPRLGQGMESGTIVRWLKTEGDAVSKGEPLYELDTDKVTQEVEAESDGVLLKIVVADGEVDVGTTVGIIGAQDEDVSAILEVAQGGNGGAPAAAQEVPAAEGPATQEPATGAPATEEPEAPSAEASRESAPKPEPAPAAETPPVRAEGEPVKASPLARRIARERGLDLAQVVGTGPEGRVIAEDIEKAAMRPAAAPAAGAQPEFEVVELTSTRKTIARRLTEAWQAPVFQLTVTADASELVATRERMVELLREGETKPTVSDVLTRIVASALMRHRAVERDLRRREDPALLGRERRTGRRSAERSGCAGDPGRGPQIRPADCRRPRRHRVPRARRQAQARRPRGWDVHDLESRDVRHRAVRRRPQPSAGGDPRDRIDRGSCCSSFDGEFAAVPTLTMTLTCDHRAIDGSEGAEFLRTVKQLVESPALAL